MLELLHEKVSGESLKAHIALFFDTYEAAAGFSLRLFT